MAHRTFKCQKFSNIFPGNVYIYNGLYLVLFSPVFLSVQDVVPKERTIEVSVAEMAFPHLQWNFHMTFRSLVLKCSSIFLRESTRELENRIVLQKNYLVGFLRQHRLQQLSRVCQSQYLVLISLIESVGVAKVFFQRLMVSERRRSTIIHTDKIFSRDLCAMLQTKNVTRNFPRRISCIVEIKHTFQRGK